jgi:hypothetical protein
MQKIILTSVVSILVLLGSNPAPSKAKEICPGPVPQDWVVIGTRTCAGCCTPGKLSTMLKVKNARKLKIGSSLTICPESTVPEGWAIIRTMQQAGGCGKAGQLVTMRVIEKLSDNEKENTDEEDGEYSKNSEKTSSWKD